MINLLGRMTHCVIILRVALYLIPYIQILQTPCTASYFAAFFCIWHLKGVVLGSLLQFFQVLVDLRQGLKAVCLQGYRVLRKVLVRVHREVRLGTQSVSEERGTAREEC
jgi:hypothetical protein